MKLNELISNFEIYTTGEEAKLLENLTQAESLDQFSDREQLVINNLIKKSLVSKFKYNGQIMVMKNEY